MSNHRHAWQVLYFRPVRPDLAIAFAVKNLDRYVLCPECGTVGMRDITHTKVAELPPDLSERRKQDASDWNAKELAQYGQG